MTQRSVGMVVRQRKPVTAPPEMTVDQAARLMKKEHVSAVMIVQKERLVGIFTERDALFRVIAANRSPHDTRVASVMTRKPTTVTAEQAFDYALFLMYEGGFRHVPVVSGDRPIGMVSARDALAPEVLAFSEQMQEREHIGEILG
jgi:CBS domain-containing protein